MSDIVDQRHLPEITMNLMYLKAVNHGVKIIVARNTR